MVSVRWHWKHRNKRLIPSRLLPWFRRHIHAHGHGREGKYGHPRVGISAEIALRSIEQHGFVTGILLQGAIYWCRGIPFYHNARPRRVSPGTCRNASNNNSQGCQMKTYWNKTTFRWDTCPSGIVTSVFRLTKAFTSYKHTVCFSICNRRNPPNKRLSEYSSSWDTFYQILSRISYRLSSMIRGSGV